MSVKYFLVPLLLTVFSVTNRAQDFRPEFLDKGIPDEMSLRYLAPERIMWISAEENVIGAANLLKEFDGQVSVSSREECVLSTRNGGEAALLLDFGREYQGSIRISAGLRNNKKPLKIRVRFGESASEAMSDVTIPDATAANDHALRDFEIAVPWLGTVEVGQSGFRFVRIDLLEENEELNLAGVSLGFRYRDIPYLRSFNCSDQRLNEIWMTGAYTVHLNMQNYLLEGVKRDRLVWLGDLHPEVMCVNTVFGANTVVGRSLDFARDDTPLPGWMNGMCSYSLWWLIIHKDLYLYRGDLGYLREQHSYVSGLVDQILSYIDGSMEKFSDGVRFLDWPTSEMPGVIHAGLQALAVMSLDSARQIGEWLGDSSLAATAGEAVERLRTYRPDDMDNKQAASLLSLAELSDPAGAADIVGRGGADGFSTFYGYYMLEAFAKAGRFEEALTIISDYWGGDARSGGHNFLGRFRICRQAQSRPYRRTGSRRSLRYTWPWRGILL